MTNPNNAIGTNGAYSGRTSVDAFNDILSAFSGRGIVSGWSISPSSGMTITLGGVSGIRDVAIAVATGGAKTTINNRSGSPVSLTIEAAPATNSRIDAIVAYVSNPPQGTTDLADNPSACGLIAVKGTTATTPTAPDEDAIRTAITADGAVGSTAYYVVLGTVKVVAGVTTLTSNYITQGVKAGVGTDNIADSAVTSDKIDFTTIGTSSQDWVLLDQAFYTADTSSQTHLELTLPKDFYPKEGNKKVDFRIFGTIEICENLSSVKYVRLNFSTDGGGDSYPDNPYQFSYLASGTSGTRQYSTKDTYATSGGFEWPFKNSGDSCTFEVRMSAMAESWWNYYSIAGGLAQPDFGPSVQVLGGRSSNGYEWHKCRLEFGTPVKFMKGSYMAIYGRVIG